MTYSHSDSTSLSGQSIVFVDPSLSDHSTLLSGINADHVVILDPQQNGIEQVSETLRQFQGLEEVHILSHGSAGSISLGNTVLNSSNISQYQDELSDWGNSIAIDGDLLFYGCNVAENSDGVDLINRISTLTQADVAASDDLTGNGGDWTFEITTGKIEAKSAIDRSTQVAYQGQLNSLTNGSNITTYWVDANQGNDTNNGLSVSSPFQTIQAAANIAQPGEIINIRGGVYRETVTVPRSGEENAPIIFQAYNNEDVVISGADQVTNWVRHAGNTWKTSVNWDANNNRENNTLFVNGDLKHEARLYAENDILDINDWGQLRRGELNTTGITSNDLKGFGNDRWNGAKIRFHVADWIIETRTIVDYESSTGTVTFDRPIGAPIQKQTNGFYIYDTIQALDKAGEWFKEADRDLLYYQVENGQNPNNLDIEFRRRGYGFDVRGKDNIEIKGIDFRGVTLNANGDTDNNLYQGNTFYGWGKGQTNGFDRFFIVGENNIFRDNEVYEAWGAALTLGGSRNQIVNNYFHDTNIGGLGGVIVSRGEEQLISYNTIRNVGRSFMDGYSIRSEISYNLLEDGGNLSWDTGFFDSDGGNGNNSFSIFHHNVLRNNNSRGIFEGFYGRNSNAVIHHNIFYNFNGGGSNRPSLAAYGKDFRQVFHNTIIGNSPLGDTNSGDAIQTRYNNNLQISTDRIASIGVDMRGNYDYSASDFANFARGDFRLAQGSGAIDNGIVIRGINEDYLGAAPDAGALEYGEAMWQVGHNFNNAPNPAYDWQAIPGTNLYTNSLFNEGFGDWTVVSGAPNVRDRNSWNSGINSLTGTFRTQSVEFLPGAAIKQTFTDLKPNTTYTLGANARIIREITKGDRFDAASGSVSTGNVRGDNYVTGLSTGEWVRYDNVDFGASGQFDTIEVLPNLRESLVSLDGVRLQVRIDSPTGPVLLDTSDLANVETANRTWKSRVRGTFGSISGERSLYVMVSGSNAENLAIGPMRLLASDPAYSDRLTVQVNSGDTTSVSTQVGTADWEGGYEPLTFTTGANSTSAEITLTNNGRIDAYLDRLYLTEGLVSVGNTNLASTDGLVSQSSTTGGLSADLAIDQGSKTYTQTENRDNSWWQVEFAQTITPGEIELFNRDDNSFSNLSNFKVSVWDKDPSDGGKIVWEKDYYSSGSVAKGGSLRIAGDEIGNDGRTRLSSTQGQLVRVQLNGKNNNGNGILSLANVQVVSSENALSRTNVALTGIAKQSSNFYVNSGFATVANDSFINTRAQFTSTKREQGAWWQVDLRQTPSIDQIRIFNRTDVASRLSNFRVSVWDRDPEAGGKEVWGKNYNSVPAGGSLPVNGSIVGDGGQRLDSLTNGRVVRIQLNGNNILSLPEVQVWAKGATDRNLTPVSIDTTTAKVDTNATRYNYDFGTESSPVAGLIGDWQRISPSTNGDIQWDGDVQAIDRGAKPGVNDINRDIVYANGSRTLSHKIANGTWDVVMNLGDSDFAHDNMRVTAEGKVLDGDVDNASGAFPYVRGRVTVTDGVLNIKIEDLGGANPDWVLSRLSLTRVDDAQVDGVQVDDVQRVDISKTSYNYDFGTATSPVGVPYSTQDWQRLSPDITGEISWSGNVSAIDRGAAPGVNDINRDFVYSNQTRTFSHRIANGVWNITLNMGDSDNAHDNMRVTAEGTVLDDDVDSAEKDFTYVTGQVIVTDGVLNIKFEDLGGADFNWVLNRMSLMKVRDL